MVRQTNVERIESDSVRIWNSHPKPEKNREPDYHHLHGSLRRSISCIGESCEFTENVKETWNESYANTRFEAKPIVKLG